MEEHDMVKYSIATCKKCGHKIYSEEDNHTSNSYVDSSGNNDRDYKHIKCPNHKTKVIERITISKCINCSAILEDRRRVTK
jgi:hypothetical protein